MEGEVFFTDSVYQPIEEEDHGLDIDHEADFNPSTSDEPKKESVKKATRDFSTQKKITQRIRQFIDEDELIRVSKTIKKLKPGQLSSGIRRMKHDVTALSKLAPEIQNTMIGPTRLKVADKAKLNELRDVRTSVEEETDAQLAPLMFYPKETDLFAFRAPGYDIHYTTTSDIKQSKVYKRVNELAQINAAINKLDVDIMDLKMESLQSFQNRNYIKEPLEYEDPKDEEETCARIRPLLKVIRRPLIKADFMQKPSTSYLQDDDDPVASLAAVHSDINGQYSLYSDIRHETLIQEEMARRGYQHYHDHLNRIAAIAESLERNKKVVIDENDSNKKGGRRKSEATEKGDEMIKMVIKRVVPSKGKNTNQEATYEISKKQDSINTKKKFYKNSLDDQGPKRKQPSSSKSSNTGISKKKAKHNFNAS